MLYEVITGEGEDLLVVGVVILEGKFHIDPLLLTAHVDRFGVQGIAVAIEIVDEGDDPPLVAESYNFV